jgi:hypothetical protein
LFSFLDFLDYFIVLFLFCFNSSAARLRPRRVPPFATAEILYLVSFSTAITPRSTAAPPRPHLHHRRVSSTAAAPGLLV